MNRKNKQNEAAKQRYQENRKKLIDLSKIARMLMEIGEADSVNDGLLNLYDKEQGKACEYNTFGNQNFLEHSQYQLLNT